MSPLQDWPINIEYNAKNTMPFRRLGPSGLRVPVFSLGLGCKSASYRHADLRLPLPQGSLSEERLLVTHSR
jgi:hypothetical protein